MNRNDDFANFCKKAVIENHNRYNIGTYSEKRLHTVLKNYICDDLNYHEVVVSDTGLDHKKTSNYIADILIGDKIYEIQTGSFYPLVPKINYYMQNTDYYVEIVYPIMLNKKVFWINKEDGEIKKPKMSPIHGSYEQLLAEMYHLLPFINNSKISFHVLLLGGSEYKTYDNIKNNKKRNPARYEIIPTELYEERIFKDKNDFIEIVPKELSQSFFAKDFAKATGLRGRAVYGALIVLCELGIILKGDKIGRSFEYRKNY